MRQLLDLLFLNKFTTILLVLPPPPLTTLLLLALNALEANLLDDLVIFNRKVNKTAILLKR